MAPLKTLPEAKKKKYVNDGGKVCPYCGATTLNATGLEQSSAWVFRRKLCMACKKAWKEAWTLVYVEEVGEGLVAFKGEAKP